MNNKNNQVFCSLTKLYIHYTPQNKIFMRKSELINRLAERTGVQKVDVLVTLEAFFQEVKDCLSVGDEVYIRGFGSFTTKYRATKIGRHIMKNEPIEIPEHYTPCFKAAKQFTDAIKEASIAQIASGKVVVKRANNNTKDEDDDE